MEAYGAILLVGNAEAEFHVSSISRCNLQSPDGNNPSRSSAGGSFWQNHRLQDHKITFLIWLIWKLICHLVRSRLIAILAHCVEQIQDVSAATEAWSCDARAVSGHGYQFCRELCAATTSPATRQWYSPRQRWEVTCGSRGEMAGGKKGGKREVRWRMMKDHERYLGFIEAYSATCMPRIHTHEKNERFWIEGMQLTCFSVMDSNDCWIINWYQLDAIRVQLECN